MGAARPAERTQTWRCSLCSAGCRAAHASAVLAEVTKGITTDTALDAAPDAASFAARASSELGAMADSLWPIARLSSGFTVADASTDSSAYATAHSAKNAARNTSEDAPKDASLQVSHAKFHLEHVRPDAATSTLDTAACSFRLATMDAT